MRSRRTAEALFFGVLPEKLIRVLAIIPKIPVECENVVKSY